MNVELLSHQYEVIADKTSKILGLVAGFGSGKTYTVARKALVLANDNPGCDGIITEPNYPLLTQILIPEIIKALVEFNIKYDFNKSDMIFTLYLKEPTRIICKSLENYERLIGINAAWVIADEFDTTKSEIAYMAFIKLLGRLRVGNYRQFVITTTPEGFKAAYKIFMEEADKSKRLIKAKTTDNIFLPPDYIQTLKDQYPENLLQAYLNGEFINLTTGSVYSYFNRDRHASSITITSQTTELIIGQDFNIGGCCSVVYIKTGLNSLVGVDEFTSNDTKGIIENIKQKYSNKLITIIPDASGNAQKTSASQSDIQMLRQAGFKVLVNSKNPVVKDRINSSNNCFDKNTVLFNPTTCPKTVKALEQHAYNERGEPEKFNGAATVDDWTDAATYPLAYLFPISKNNVSRQELSFS